MMFRNTFVGVTVLATTEVLRSRAVDVEQDRQLSRMSLKIHANGASEITTSQHSQRVSRSLMRAEPVEGVVSFVNSTGGRCLQGHEANVATPEHIVALYSVRHKRYVCMNDHAQLIGSEQMPFNPYNFPVIWWWCVFKVVDLGTGLIGFHHKTHNRFIQMMEDGRAGGSSKMGSYELPEYAIGERFKAVYLEPGTKGVNWDKYGGMVFHSEKNQCFLSMLGNNSYTEMGSSEKARSTNDPPRSWTWMRFKLLDLTEYKETTTPPPAMHPQHQQKQQQ